MYAASGKMSEKRTIQHTGMVESVRTDGISVRILQASACSSCSARRLCRSSESKEKIIDVRGCYPTFQPGDMVAVSGTIRQGLRATLLAYILPLLLMVAALSMGAKLGNDGIGAATALTVVGIYYGILFLLRDKIGRTVSFDVTPLGPDKKGNKS